MSQASVLKTVRSRISCVEACWWQSKDEGHVLHRALSTLILLTTGGYILRKATMPGWWVWIVWVRTS